MYIIVSRMWSNTRKSRYHYWIYWTYLEFHNIYMQIKQIMVYNVTFFIIYNLFQIHQKYLFFEIKGNG